MDIKNGLLVVINGETAKKVATEEIKITTAETKMLIYISAVQNDGEIENVITNVGVSTKLDKTNAKELKMSLGKFTSILMNLQDKGIISIFEDDEEDNEEDDEEFQKMLKELPF